MKTLLIWIVSLGVLFVATYTVTGVVYNRVMADFYVEPTVTGLTTLEVKDNYGTQNNQIYTVQPAVTPIGKDTREVLILNLDNIKGLQRI